MMKEEEEAVTSNDMNNDDDINSFSDSDNNRIGDDNCNLNQINQIWGTWEELVLTCAVKRHGSTDWDSVAKEVASRSSLDVSGGNCKVKYQDLKRRFQDSGDDDGERNSEATAVVVEEDSVGEITWLEKLRNLRLAELRREIQRRDDSILSLQLKVKKLKEEKDENEGDNKPDLEVKSQARLNRDTTESERDNRSMNESNSTASVDHERLTGDKNVQANENSRNPDPDPKAAEVSHSGELGESGTSTSHEKKKSHGEDIKSAGDKSQPLIDMIMLIRSHPRGCAFESRLKSQETKNYRRLIKQHLDIKTIEKKIKKGSYVSSSLCFYRDVKLLFTNAIVFFPPSSSEFVAAQELRTLVSKEMKKVTSKSNHNAIKVEAETSASRLVSLVACKKKSSSSKKISPSSSLKQKEEVSEEKTPTTITTTTVTATRSSRRMSKDTKMGRAKKQVDSKKDDEEEEESSKIEKRTSYKKKSAAEFLKRIKKNSPQKEKETSKDEKNIKSKPRELRSKKRVEVENKSSSKRKQTKREGEEVSVKGKRSRESGKDNQQPKKRSRR